jgi:hypothetical protein
MSGQSGKGVKNLFLRAVVVSEAKEKAIIIGTHLLWLSRLTELTETEGKKLSEGWRWENKYIISIFPLL